MNTEQYFEHLSKEIEKNYAMAREARKKGIDPKDEVEIPLALTMAAKVVRLIATVYPQLDREDIINRLLELEQKYGALEPQVSFAIAEEIAKEKYCKFETQLEAMDAGIRVGFAYTTLGVVASPIEGYTELKTGETKEGKKYFKAYFSGPIRSAGTTATCVVLMLIDYIRQVFGYARYDPTEKECKRFVTELLDYHDRVTNLQYLPTEEEMMFIAKNMPIQISGDPTEKREVSNYKDLKRIDTNFIRGGFCLVAAEGLAQKAKKGLRLLKKVQDSGFKVKDWEWLDEYVELHEKRDSGDSDSSPTYIKDLVAGRPVFGHPGRGFRFRYGRSRVAGFSAVSVHPATMAVTRDFIATGTQLKIEKPTKGCVTTPCDVIDGPIVKFKNGGVKKMTDYSETKAMLNEIEEVIYLGDLLFPLGDVQNRNCVLIKPGYVEEWWGLELKKADGVGVENPYKVDLDSAIKFSKENKVPLHPSYIYYWTQIDFDSFLGFIDWLQHSRLNSGKLLFPYNPSEKERFQVGKRALELLGVEHEVTIENVVLDESSTKALLINLGLENVSELHCNYDFKKANGDGKEVLEIVNELSNFKIKDKAGEFIGSRMGRPEKAKIRKLTGSPNVLFPIGEEGGRLRSLNVAVEKGYVKSTFPYYYCEECKRETIYRNCEGCGKKTKQKYYCNLCDREVDKEKCEVHERGNSFKNMKIDVKYYFDKAREKLGMLKTDIPELIKGVRGTSSAGHDFENPAKGILRAKYNIQVNKDGTIRYDMTELPLSHFKPCEIGVSVSKLKELGYDRDLQGDELVEDNQILDLKPHDVILPCNELSGDEPADKIFMNITKFMDEMLEKLYGLPRFYNIEKREDLVGQLGVCMAPHNCAGVICRFLGFSKVQGLLASAYMHAAIRRDCFDYDTYIPIKQGDYWRNVRIGKLVEELEPGNDVDKFGTREKKVEGFETIGFKNGLKNIKVNNFTKHTKIPMLEIKTSLGKVIKVTENHKFLVDGIRKRTSELKIGDKLPLPRKIDIKSLDLKEVNLIDFLKDEDLMIRGVRVIIDNLDSTKREKILHNLKITKKQFMNFKLRDSYPIKFILELDDNYKKQIYNFGKIATKRDNVEVPIIIKLTDNLLKVIGLYIAEGYSRSIGGKKGLNQVYISGEDLDLRKLIMKTIFDVFGLKPSEKKEDRVTFSSKVLYLFFTKILEAGSIAKEKRIPYLFLNLPLNKLAFVLSGYFEGDGSASLSDIRVSCDSVSEGLLSDLEFCLARFGIFAKRYKYKKEPGNKLKEFYTRKKRKIPIFEITKLIIGSDFIKDFMQIGFLSKRKNKILKSFEKRKPYGMRINYDDNFVYDPIVSISEIGEKESYCLNVDTNNHLVVANSIVTKNCDGDEAALMLLGDVLLNFSRKFLPAHRGGTQDAPLVLNGRIYAKEVDDQILDFELVDHYPLELYEKAEQGLHSGEIEIEMVKQRLGRGEDPYINTGFTHDTGNFNEGATCSSYKTLPTMREKVVEQMELCKRLRSVDESDVARLIIDRHFMRDLKGNLRKFSQQKFRCSSCNESFRRPPLAGKCTKCNGKIIFTISYGSIVKYLEPGLELTRNYNVPPYIIQDLKLTKKYIESIFGKDNEKQIGLKEFM